MSSHVFESLVLWKVFEISKRRQAHFRESSSPEFLFEHYTSSASRGHYGTQKTSIEFAYRSIGCKNSIDESLLAVRCHLGTLSE
jgi:hypothetical protein